MTIGDRQLGKRTTLHHPLNIGMIRDPAGIFPAFTDPLIVRVEDHCPAKRSREEIAVTGWERPSQNMQELLG